MGAFLRKCPHFFVFLSNATLAHYQPDRCIDIARKPQQNFRMDRARTLILPGALVICGLAFGGQHNGRFISASRYSYVPPSPQKSVNIGNFYLRKKAYRGALSRFREAVRADPDYAPAYLGLGKVYDKMGHYQKALEAYKAYLNDLPSDRDAEKAKGAHSAVVRLKRKLASKSVRAAPLETEHGSAAR